MATISRLYDRLEDAAAAVDALVAEGFDRDDVGLISAYDHEDFSVTAYGSEQLEPPGGEENPGAGAAAGAAIGAALGGATGVLMGMGLLLVPGVGPALALGPLLSGLAGAGIGGASGGVAGALMRAGIPPVESNEYSEALRRGSSLVIVHVPGERVAEAGRVLDRFGPIPMKTRRAAELEGGHERPDAASAPVADAEVDAAHRRTFGDVERSEER